MNERASQIIDTAIKMIREGGYHSFSFRQIATELGIKSASIHYHFPSKEDLGVAVMVRYTEIVVDAIADFTRKNIDWLEQALRLQCADWSEEKVQETALSMFSALEGGIAFAALSQQPSHLKQVGDWLKKMCA